MSLKLEKIAAEREKARRKRDEWEERRKATFSDIKTENKAAFFESLKVFQNNNPNFLSSIINRELASKFWSI